MTLHARRRIVFVLPTLGGGGAERVVVTLLRHLDRSRFEPHLVLATGGEAYLRELPADVAVHALGMGQVRRALGKILTLLWRLRPALVVSTQGYMNFALLLLHPLLPPTRLVVREVIGERYFEDSRYRHLFYRWYLRAVRRADRIVTQSDASARDLARRVRARPGQIVRLHNPVDADHLAERARASANPFEGPGPHLLAVGRLDHQKGFDLLIDALAGVRAAGVPAVLTILGEGAERPALEAAARRLGVAPAVRFPGFRDDPYPYYAHADVFVLSSRYEGLPNVVLEALACGCPVVAFDCPHGVREVVSDGVNGVLLPPEDVGGLRDALVRVLRSPEERARLCAGIPASVAPFSAPVITRAWEALFDGLGDRRAAPMRVAEEMR